MRFRVKPLVAAHSALRGLLLPFVIHKRQFPPSSRVLKSRIEHSRSDIRRGASRSIPGGIYSQLAGEWSLQQAAFYAPLLVAFMHFGVWADKYRPIITINKLL